MYDFDNIIANDRIIKSLQRSVKNKRINHAYIFDGAKGMGKHTIASAFAKTLNCSMGGISPCGNCVSCRTFESGNNPDIIYIKRKGEEKEIKVDNIRDNINGVIGIKPYSNRYKIFIIENADTMNISAQNALLKTLEEPPEYAVFILLAENYNKLLLTIQSRCQRFSMQCVSTEKIKTFVMDKLGLDEHTAQMAALYSRGSIGRALTLAESEEFNALRDNVAERTISLLETDLIGLYRLTGEMDSFKDNIDSYLEIMYLLYRDCLVYCRTGNEKSLVQKDRVRYIKKITELTGTKRLIRGCELIEAAIDNLRKRGDFQLVIENLFFKLKEK